MGRVAAVIAVGVAAVAAGVFTLGVARDDPAYWFAGTSAAAGAALLAAGWGLVGSGLAFWLWRPQSRCGPLLASAGLAWFVPEWNNPGIGSAVAFTAGLGLYAACPPLVGHAVLAYPGGRLGSKLEAGTVALAYLGGVVVLGLLPALLFDPRAQSCFQCPPNLLGVADGAGLVDDLTRAGVYLGLVWSIALAALAVWRLVRAPRAIVPVLAVGAAYLGLVGAWFAVSLEHGELSTGTFDRRLWLAQAIALVGVALGVGWAWLGARRARSTVARLVVDLGRSPPPGGLRDALAEIIGDPGLVLAYPVGAPEKLVDARGYLVEPSPEQERTTLIRDGRAVAELAHRPGLLRDQHLVEEVATASRLALENERLRAEARARVEELRASRARIVEAGDAERKRLERDLHDGAQQRLVALSLSLSLLRQRRPDDPALDLAEAELRTATAELRELAHGIFPAVLADEGLGAAVEALAEEAPIPVRIGELPEARLPLPVETAAYTVVAEAARSSTAALDVRATQAGRELVVEVVTTGADGLDVVGLEDRVGALDGRLVVERGADGQTTLRAELPCAS
jgi:signal transduction histidine kinase